tara:strand:- start:465 stop:1370 length:906 start_codon:yes stop_codon:yes gene_type:complete
MKEELNYLKDKFGKNVIFEENLAKYNWFNVGGSAEIFFRPISLDQLCEFYKAIKNLSKPIHLIGAGSNTLVRDGGVKGVVIKLGSKFSYLKRIKKNIIEAGAATLDKNLANFAMENSIGGFEFMSCIPGSVGGAIIMNSGCYDEDISMIIKSVKILNIHGEVQEVEKDDIKFVYRGSSIKNSIIISAKFEGIVKDKYSIKKKQEDLINKKKETQPKNIKTGGSTFKNPPNLKAWKLIDDSDCKNISVGKAKISNLHSNFFINSGNASSKDIETLMQTVKKKVEDKTGISLELEIKLIGEKN